MSTAATSAGAAPKKGKKKLLVLVLVAVLALGGAGVGALLWLKQKAAAEQHEDDEAPRSARASRDPKAVPAFVPLDVFTVNLADREAERYAQVGITFELSDAKEADRIKNFMPAIRNNILMLLAHKTSTELLAREGKLKLAREVRRETERALGLEVDEEEEEEALAEEDAADEPPKKKRRKRRAGPVGPVQAVHFSNFIIQ